jgi:hypothetical protein
VTGKDAHRARARFSSRTFEHVRASASLQCYAAACRQRSCKQQIPEPPTKCPDCGQEHSCFRLVASAHKPTRRRLSGRSAEVDGGSAAPRRMGDRRGADHLAGRLPLVEPRAAEAVACRGPRSLAGAFDARTPSECHSGWLPGGAAAPGRATDQRSGERREQLACSGAHGYRDVIVAGCVAVRLAAALAFVA